MLDAALGAVGGLGGMFGGGGETSSAQASASTAFTSGPFGGAKSWRDYLPVILLAVVVLVLIKKGG